MLPHQQDKHTHTHGGHALVVDHDVAHGAQAAHDARLDVQEQLVCGLDTVRGLTAGSAAEGMAHDIRPGRLCCLCVHAHARACMCACARAPGMACEIRPARQGSSAKSWGTSCRQPRCELHTRAQEQQTAEGGETCRRQASEPNVASGFPLLAANSRPDLLHRACVRPSLYTHCALCVLRPTLLACAGPAACAL